jgi:Ca2+/Na+ antiporter
MFSQIVILVGIIIVFFALSNFEHSKNFLNDDVKMSLAIGLLLLVFVFNNFSTLLIFGLLVGYLLYVRKGNMKLDMSSIIGKNKNVKEMFKNFIGPVSSVNLGKYNLQDIKSQAQQLVQSYFTSKLVNKKHDKEKSE